MSFRFPENSAESARSPHPVGVGSYAFNSTEGVAPPERAADASADLNPAPGPARAEWTRRPERSNALALRFMGWFSLRLGRTAARVLLYLIALYFLVFSPTARRAVADWLRRVQGQGEQPRSGGGPRQSDWQPGWRALFRHFLTFATAVHDRVFLINDQFSMFDIHLYGQELAIELREQGRGLMLMGAHMGSFEVLRSLGRQQPGLRVAMAMYPKNAQMINQLLNAINPNAGVDVVELGQVDSMLQLHALLNANTIVGMMGDRALGDEPTRTIPFFGQPARFPLGPFRMAAILRRPVIFMVGLYRGGRRYDIHFEKLADFSDVPAGGRQAEMEAAMDRYAGLLEKYGRMAPHNWFNFYDFWQAPAGIDAGVVQPAKT